MRIPLFSASLPLLPDTGTRKVSWQSYGHECRAALFVMCIMDPRVACVVGEWFTKEQDPQMHMGREDTLQSGRLVNRNRRACHHVRPSAYSPDAFHSSGVDDRRGSLGW